jgi:hypothetical protein
MDQHAPDRSPTTAPAVLLLLGLLLAALLGYSATRPERAGADETISAVYLVRGLQRSLDADMLRAAGVRLVTSAEELAAAAPSAQAIIIDRDALDTVDPAWLATQYRQEKLIGGVNIPSLLLAEWIGYQNIRPNVGGFLQDYGGRPFYFWFYDMTEQSGVRRGGASSDAFSSTEDFIGRLRYATESSQAQLNPPQYGPRPTRTRPRP